MKRLISATALAILLSCSAAVAAETVQYTMAATLDSLRDPARKDRFEAGITDAKMVTNLALECVAGRSKWMLIKSDEQCSVSGTGSVIAPSGTQLPRTQYLGGFKVASDGYTAGETLQLNYLAVGQVPASSASFAGSMLMKPENPSVGAGQMRDIILAKVKASAGVSSTDVIDDRIDSVEFSRLFVPSAGLPTDKGCTWSGDMIYAYQTESWSMRLIANCNGTEYKLSGNMPWVDKSDEEAAYNLNLVLPNNTVTSDDALFASPGGDADLFAAVDGIAATLEIKKGSPITVQVDGEPEDLNSSYEVSGSFVGTNVPLDVVRSFAIVFTALSRTFFGA